MGIQLPEALAGDDNEIEADTEGVMKVLRLTGGVAAAGVIVGLGLHLKNRLMNAAGADEASNIGLNVA